MLWARWKTWVFNCPLEIEGKMQILRKIVPDDQSCNVETLSAKFRCCSQYGQVITFHGVESSLGRKICCLCADMLEVCGTLALDTVKCKEC